MNPLTGERIRFFCSFRLIHEPGSEAEADFLREYEALGTLPQVEGFQLMRDVTPPEWSACRHVVMMEFADVAAHTAFHEEPAHNKFVSERWDAEVAEFKGGNAVALDAKLAVLPGADLATPR